MDHKIQLLDLTKISLRMNSCLILHNVLVTDRVMNSCELMYDPANSVEVEPEFVEQVDEIDEIDVNLNDIVDDSQLALSNERIIQQLSRNNR